MATDPSLTPERLARAMADAGYADPDLNEQWALPLEGAAAILKALGPGAEAGAELLALRSALEYGHRHFQHNGPIDRCGEVPCFRLIDLSEQAASPSHPEAFCERCHRPNLQAWWVESSIWNATLRRTNGSDEWDVLCPQCFSEIAEAKGIVKLPIWELKLDKVRSAEPPPLAEVEFSAEYDWERSDKTTVHLMLPSGKTMKKVMSREAAKEVVILARAWGAHITYDGEADVHRTRVDEGGLQEDQT